MMFQLNWHQLLLCFYTCWMQRATAAVGRHHLPVNKNKGTAYRLRSGQISSRTWVHQRGERGCINPGRRIIVVIWILYCWAWYLWTPRPCTLLPPCHPFGVLNFEMDPRFWKICKLSGNQLCGKKHLAVCVTKLCSRSVCVADSCTLDWQSARFERTQFVCI